MHFVENPLKKGPKRVKITEKKAMNENTVDMEGMKVDLVRAIKAMAKILYEREHVKEEGPIYAFDEMRRLFQEIELSLKDFFDQLYLAARPLGRNEQTMEHMKKLMVFICYLLASLNNTKVNSFKFDIAYYLDSVGTSNEGLNTMANIGMTTTARAVDRRKKKMSDTHGKYVENALVKYSNNAFVLNVDDYHNIHVQRHPDTTDTSWATYMATIIANPCFTPAIPHNGTINPKIVDYEVIARHLDRQFIVNLGISYHDRSCMQGYVEKECSEDDLINRLTLHSYNDRLAERKSERHVQNAILVDFVESSLKGIEAYMKAL